MTGMLLTRRLWIVALIALATTRASAQDIRLEISGGLVTLSAKAAPVSEILKVWSNIGRTVIVNGERVSGQPVSLALAGVPEQEALRILLNSAAGYVVAVRTAPDPAASIFDRIVISGSSSVTAAAPVRPAIAAAGWAGANPEDSDPTPPEQAESESGRPLVVPPGPLRPPTSRILPPNAATGVPAPGMIVVPPQESAPGSVSPGAVAFPCCDPPPSPEHLEVSGPQ